MTIHYHTADVSGIKIFYREAGSPSAPTLVDVLLEAIRNTVKDASSPHRGKEILR